MTRRKHSHLDRLGELREQAVKARGRAREAQLAHQAAVGRIEELREQRIRALTQADEPAARRLEDERDQAEPQAADLGDRAEAAERQLSDAEAELGAYAASHLHALMRERGPAAQAAAEAIENAIIELVRAAANWHAEQAATTQLLRLAGESSADLPRLPTAIVDLVRAARRTDGISVSPPIPIPSGPLPTAA